MQCRGFLCLGRALRALGCRAAACRMRVRLCLSGRRGSARCRACVEDLKSAAHSVLVAGVSGVSGGVLSGTATPVLVCLALVGGCLVQAGPRAWAIAHTALQSYSVPHPLCERAWVRADLLQ